MQARQETEAHRAVAAGAGEEAAAVWLLGHGEHVPGPPALRHGRCGAQDMRQLGSAQLQLGLVNVCSLSGYKKARVVVCSLLPDNSFQYCFAGRICDYGVSPERLSASTMGGPQRCTSADAARSHRNSEVSLAVHSLPSSASRNSHAYTSSAVAQQAW